MKRLFKFFLLMILCALCSCGYDNGTETMDRSYINVETLSLSRIDSLILAEDSTRADSGEAPDHNHTYENYKPFSKTLLDAASDDSLALPIIASIRRDTTASNLSYFVNVHDEWMLWIDVIGCSDENCLNANSIIIHDKEYDYVEKLTSEDFEFSKPSKNYYSKEFGPDCDLYVSYFFDLNIHAKDVKFKASVQHAKETCDVKFYL